MRIPTAIVAGAALCLAAPASASTDFAGVFSASLFDSKGACERDLNQERNARRQSGDIGPHVRADTYNAWARWYFGCMRVGPNTWLVLRIR